MSISKEERERMRRHIQIGSLSHEEVDALLTELDLADKRIAELQQENERLRTGLQGLRQALAEHFTNSHIQQEPLPAGHAYLNRIDVLLEGDARDWRRS